MLKRAHFLHITSLKLPYPCCLISRAWYNSEFSEEGQAIDWSCMSVKLVACQCLIDGVPYLETSLVAWWEEISLVYREKRGQCFFPALSKLMKKREVVRDVPEPDSAVLGASQQVLPMLGQAWDRGSMEGENGRSLLKISLCVVNLNDVILRVRLMRRHGK